MENLPKSVIMCVYVFVHVCKVCLYLQKWDESKGYYWNSLEIMRTWDKVEKRGHGAKGLDI